MKNIALITAVAAMLLADTAFAQSTEASPNLSLATDQPLMAVFDNVGPVLRVSKTPRSTKARQILIKGTVTDKVGTVDRIEYRVDGEVPKNAMGLPNWRFFLPLKKGVNVVTITAIDRFDTRSLSKVIRIQRK